jgi:hypothetical protein
MTKPKFKLGDRVKFTRVAQRNMTLLAAENDPKPWWDVKWEPAVPHKIVRLGVEGSGYWRSVGVGEQQGIYIGTRTKLNGILAYDNSPDELRRKALFKRLASVPCGLVVTDARKSPILVLIEDLEHV